MADEQGDIRLDISNKFYDQLDSLIDKSYKEDNISYGEIELALLKMGDKMLQQKMTLMHQYLHEEHPPHTHDSKNKDDKISDEPKKETDSSMYG
tara:strand:- start:3712 stop:3993 length:282 start_codon:yes stop_codon:yes gene_type:complete